MKMISQQKKLRFKQLPQLEEERETIEEDLGKVLENLGYRNIEKNKRDLDKRAQELKAMKASAVETKDESYQSLLMRSLPMLVIFAAYLAYVVAVHFKLF